VFEPYIVWLLFAGVTFFVIGLFAVRRELLAAHRLDKVIVLGSVFFAVPLAVFGAEHLALAKVVMNVVPAWIPAHLFWTYFVGFALLAAAASIVVMKHVRLSATLLGVMFFLFVLLIHLPNAAAKPGDRFLWAVALRDLAFGGGAWALAGTQTEEWRVRGSSSPIVMGRLCIAVPAVFFGVEHFLHPEFAPGVPLEKLTPAWIPVRVFWGYFTGAVLIAAGAALLVNKRTRAAAAWLGAVITLLVLFIYVPILAAARQPSEGIEGINYVADTLLFGGAVLLLAAAMPRDHPAQAAPSPSAHAS